MCTRSITIQNTYIDTVNHIRGVLSSRSSSLHIVCKQLKDHNDVFTALWPPSVSYFVSSKRIYGIGFTLAKMTLVSITRFGMWFQSLSSMKCRFFHLWETVNISRHSVNKIYGQPQHTTADILWNIPVICMTHNVCKQFGTNVKAEYQFPPEHI